VDRDRGCGSAGPGAGSPYGDRRVALGCAALPLSGRRGGIATTLSTSRTIHGSLIHVVVATAQARRIPAKVIAAFGLSPSTFAKIIPNVTVWTCMGTTIIMLTIPT
jgi:hypothetical protein